MPKLHYSSEFFSDVRRLEKEDRLSLQKSLLQLAFDSEVSGPTYPTGDSNGREIRFLVENDIINLLGYRS